MSSRSDFIPNFEVRSVLLLAALSVGPALAARAQTGVTVDTRAQATSSARTIDAAFQRADANRDGKLSRQEAARFPAIELRFEQIDLDRDQAISREEFEAALKT